MNMPKCKNQFFLFAFGCVAAFMWAGCSNEEGAKKSSSTETSSAATDEGLTERDRVAIVSRSENLLQELASEMKQLGGSFCSVDPSPLPFVSEDLTFVGITDKHAGGVHSNDDHSHSLPASSHYCTIATDESLEDLTTLFEPITQSQPLNDMQIGTLSASFITDDQFQMETKLEGKLRRDDGTMIGLKGYQTLTWRKDGDWKLVHWKQKKLKVTQSEMGLFEDVTASVFPDPETRKTLSRSSHQELIRKMVEQATASGGEMGEPREEFKGFADWFSSYQ